MTSIELQIRNASGLHARPAALFVRTAGAQRARIRVRNITRGTAEADAKSLLGIMGLGVSRGHWIEVSADGDDEMAGLAAIRAAVKGGLGEPVEPIEPGGEVEPGGPGGHDGPVEPVDGAG